MLAVLSVMLGWLKSEIWKFHLMDNVLIRKLEIRFFFHFLFVYCEKGRVNEWVNETKEKTCLESQHQQERKRNNIKIYCKFTSSRFLSASKWTPNTEIKKVKKKK